MSHNSMNILDLPKLVKIARERAVLGLYADSLNSYKKCLVMIQR